jgi:hypothetical protein
MGLRHRSSWLRPIRVFDPSVIVHAADPHKPPRLDLATEDPSGPGFTDGAPGFPQPRKQSMDRHILWKQALDSILLVKEVKQLTAGEAYSLITFGSGNG